MTTNLILTLIGLAIAVIAGHVLIRWLVERQKRARWWSSLDAQWQAIFKEAIGINREPTETELVTILSLTQLDCHEKKLTSLEPLRALTGLQTLNCGGNQLTNLEPLQALTRLQDLNCKKNLLTNLEPLRALTGLQSLDCSHNQLTNLEPLRALTGLQQLDCESNQLTSLEPLRALTGLQTLDCSFNQLTSLEPLQTCSDLQTLVCWNNQLTNLEPLLACTGLQTLECSLNQLTSLEGLQACTDLQTLSCIGNQLTSLEPLRACTDLQNLDCSGNQLTNLEPLQACPGLQTLDCENNQLTSLESLHDLKSLRKLECGRNPLSQPDMERFQKAVPSCEISSTTRRDRLEAQRERDKFAAERISEITYFSPAFRTGLKHCKYATWAADLTEEQLLVLLWLVGECMARISFIYSTLVEELPKSEGHQERKRMIIALKMLVDLLEGPNKFLQESPKEADSSANSEVTETPTGDTQHPLSLLNAIVDNMFDHILSRQPFSLEEVREHIDSSCNNKVMVQMQTLLLSEMSGFSEDFRHWLTKGKYTRWALHNLTEGSLFGLISLVGEYGHHAVFLREILHRRLEESRYYPGNLRITAAFKMLAKMVRGQRWSLDKMRSLISSSPRDTKVLDDWPSIDTKVL